MPQVDLPTTLGFAHWDRQKGALAKAPKVPATRLGDELKALARLHVTVDWKSFVAAAPDAAAAQHRLDEAVKGKIKALTEQAQAVAAAADKFLAEARKIDDFPKEPLAAVASIAQAAKEYRVDIDAAVAALRKVLVLQLDKDARTRTQALENWKAERDAAIGALRAMARRVAGAKGVDASKAILEINEVIKRIPAEPTTTPELAKLEDWLRRDETLKALEDAPPGQEISKPLLRAAERLRTALP